MKDLNKKMYQFIDEVANLNEPTNEKSTIELVEEAKELRSEIVFYNAKNDPKIGEALLSIRNTGVSIIKSEIDTLLICDCGASLSKICENINNVICCYTCSQPIIF